MSSESGAIQEVERYENEYVARRKNEWEKQHPFEVWVEQQLERKKELEELTHDTIYKPKITAQPGVKRTVAKSMALIEATDEFFEQAMKNLDEASRAHRELLDFLAFAYEKGTGLEAGNERSNQILIDTYIDLLPPAPFAEINDYLSSKSFIFNKIKEQHGVRHFFGQPTVLLAYYLADTKPAQMRSRWPDDGGDLAKVYSDLGKSFDG